jgi:hypothetical protein
MNTLSQKSTFKYRVGVLRNNQKKFLTDWRANLILDSGLDKQAAVRTASCFGYVLLGNQVSPDPVRRDSSPITFTVSGTTCTASGSFFLSTDTGRLIKFNNVGGDERYLTYVNSTTATLSSTATVSGVTATIWYVNQTSLQSFVVAYNSYSTTGGGNGSSITGNVSTRKRTFIGTPLAGPYTFTEIGFNDSSSNTNLFDRDIIPGGVSLLTGDQVIVECSLITTFTPDSARSVGNVATGFDSSGQCIITGILNTTFDDGISYVKTNGSSTNQGSVMDPYGSIGFVGITASFSLPSFGNGDGSNPLSQSVGATSSTVTPYVNGTFYKDIVTTWSAGVATGTFYGINIVSSKCFFIQEFTAPLNILSTQSLSLTFRKTWQRTLVN